MGRGRGKGKKQSVMAEDPGSEEDKVPAYRRRGRPLKPLTAEIEEVEVTEIIEKDEENVKGNGSTNELKTQPITINKRKRKRSTQVKEKIDPMKDDNGILAKSSPDDSIKSTGFWQNGSQRKNKPRRAAEAGVDCK
ncbi:uncharacterized protein LOC106766702 [Vigna radiata var. radiata]|uniref:Uncharacterized protein LOC106766702 n=1 Tax=Vigna radiata var. radiata TaxID=3916 RepID=A0A1S3ULT1_VIGRR|nr:uncharacterized protein LOC106766702 [Vigna radiata var. radiata]